MKPFNFYSGPAILPDEVLRKSAEAIENFAGTGLSILEVSHRSKEFVKVMDETIALAKDLMQLDVNHEVIFLQGGGSTQFCMVPMNLLNDNEAAAYFDTGQWAHNAMEEAKNFGKVHVAASSLDSKYTSIPKAFTLPEKAKYIHLTTNNTIYGTQFKLQHPVFSTNQSLVADMSSDIFSRHLDFNRFDLIYAAAQKNFGAAGVTMAVVNKNILGKVERKIPKMMDYRVHIEKQSMHNTPSVFAVYVAYLTLHWTKQQGIKNLEQQNELKAKLIYDAIDNAPLFETFVVKEDRSLMNVCFHVRDKTHEEKFMTFCKQRNIVGIKGYRTVGGFRASIYNAMTLEGAKALANTVADFKGA